MIRRFSSWLLLLSLLATLGANAIMPATQPPALLLISLPNEAAIAQLVEVGLPVFAHFEGTQGSYVLVGAEADTLTATTLDYQILDSDTTDAHYYFAYSPPGWAMPNWDKYGQLLFQDAQQVLLRITPEKAEELAATGVDLVAITFDPKPFPFPQTKHNFPTAITPDPTIQGMIDQVTSAAVTHYDRSLSGELPVMVGGSPYTIVSRHSYSGEPLEKATQYVGEHFDSLGLSVEYHVWNASRPPNVIGEITGLTNPDEIFVISAHLDNMPSGAVAPGADDNASGSTATLIAADIFSQYQWGCTLKFGLWTGEEQGLLGSKAYALRASNDGDNIIGVLNMDMIAWNTPSSSPDMEIHARSSIPASITMAQVVVDVIDAYNLDIIPHIEPSGTGASDHASFWTYGYPAILSTQYYYGNDFNPYYHSVQDTYDHIDLSYFTEQVRATVGAVAHLSGCLIPNSDTGTVQGEVTAVDGGSPIGGATVLAQSSIVSTTVMANGMGVYTHTLPAGVYTITAMADGYMPAFNTGVTIISSTVTTQDFALSSLCTPLSAITVTQTTTGTVTVGDEVWFEAEAMPADAGTPITYTISIDGTPITPTITSNSSTITFSHQFQQNGAVMVEVQAQNCDGGVGVNAGISIDVQPRYYLYLPIIKR